MMKRGDYVGVLRGVNKGRVGKITEVSPDGKRVGVQVDEQPYSLAASSVKPIKK